MAQGITDSVIEEIKSRTDLSELISSYGIQVKLAGAAKKACCPFHNEKTPSFHINDSKGFYHCFGCGESGDAIRFVQKMEGLSFVEAVKKLAGIHGIKIEERKDPALQKTKRLFALMSDVAAFYKRCLEQTKEAALAREYLKKRAFDGQLIDEWLIGYAPKGVAVMCKWAEKHNYTLEELEQAGIIIAPKNSKDKGYHRFGGRLMFSIKDKSARVVAFSGRYLGDDKRIAKYVNSPETPIFKKSNVLFGYDKAAAFIARQSERECIICEGQIDVIKLHDAGFRNAVASQGTAFTLEHAKLLKKVSDAAVLIYDDDKAGRNATVKVAKKLLELEMPVRTVTLPDGHDPDSFLKSNTAEELRNLVSKAESIVAFQIRAESMNWDNPKSINACNKIAQGVLETISSSKNAIIKASLLQEASRLLSLPFSALEKELQKIKISQPPVESVHNEQDYDYQDDVEDLEKKSKMEIEAEIRNLTPAPSSKEMSFMSFLFANEANAELLPFVEKYIPNFLFSNPFTVKFFSAWAEGLEKGCDMISNQSFSVVEQEWLSSVISKSLQSESASSKALLISYAKVLWQEYLIRERGNLTADVTSDFKRMQYTVDIKRINSASEESFYRIIQPYMTDMQTE
jgi:DNA primase